MMRRALGLAAALVLSLSGSADGGGPGGDRPAGAPIRVTINPEGRVSVSIVGEMPPPAPCGTPVEVGVTVVNLGFITGRLEARLVGVLPAGTALEFPSEPLKGVPQETRFLRITLKTPAPTDLTIAFRLRNEIPDLGGRDRIHMLMRCK